MRYCMLCNYFLQFCVFIAMLRQPAGDSEVTFAVFESSCQSSFKFSTIKTIVLGRKNTYTHYPSFLIH